MTFYRDGVEIDANGKPVGQAAETTVDQAAHEALIAERDQLKALIGDSDVNALREDSAALTQHREALGGELLAADFPGRKALFAARYFTKGHLAGVDKAGLVALKDIGDATADAILAAQAKK